ncbi:MAG TPA: GDSL-type esterase/lipase family protein [Ktedonobacteraceae bacterium]|nr:GDSL-type esterase/lipase family protein [Ktedonobacteraceae bacterium]
MTLDERTRAVARACPARHGRMKALFFALALCLLMLAGASCAQAATTQAGKPGAATQRHNSQKQITYVAIGASDTFGIGTEDPYSDNWPTDLVSLLGATNIHLINLGIPGILIHDALRLELPVALDAHPDLVTIWLGVNDVANDVTVNSFASDLDTLLSRLQAAAPHARIAIANIPDLTLLPYFAAFDTQALGQQIHEYDAAIDSIVQRHHVILVDLTQQSYNLQAHPEWISSDGLHPNDIGYLMLASLFYKALQTPQK